MLNERERHRVVVFLRYFCTVAFLPLDVDVGSWEIRPGVKSAWKKLACGISFGMFLVHTLYQNLSLVHAFVFMPETPIHQMVIHMILAASATGVSFWYYELFIQHPGVTVSFISMTLAATAAGGDTPSLTGANEKPWIDRLREYSRQDLIAVCLPYMIFVELPIITASFAYDPTLRLLVYAALPEGFKTWPWFLLCFVEEVRFLVVLASIITPVYQCQVISFELVNTHLQNILSSKQPRQSRDMNMAQGNYKSLRRLQLYVTMLNIVNRNLIFTFKLLSIGIATTSGYAAIAHFTDHPIFGTMFYFIFFDAAIIYMVLYGDAFKTPDLFKQVVQQTLLQLGKRRKVTVVEMKILKRQLESIRAVDIKVGEFHALERTSTPIYVDYVLTNIVNMLVAFN